MMPGDLRDAALRYLRDHNVVTLATNGPQGLWAAAVFYASRDFTLYFLSAPHTRHATNIHSQPRVAATIQEDYEAWPDIKGIQLEGSASRLEGKAERQALEAFSAKYPFIGSLSNLADALTGIRWYGLVPERLYFIDNAQGLGHRDEVPLLPTGRD
jgi:uncharacterized protein YhbP (UPF0306 family)